MYQKRKEQQYLVCVGGRRAVYVVKRDLLINSGCRLGGKIGFVEMSKSDSIDIDTPDDFILAEQIMKLKNV